MGENDGPGELVRCACAARWRPMATRSCYRCCCPIPRWSRGGRRPTRYGPPTIHWGHWPPADHRYRIGWPALRGTGLDEGEPRQRRHRPGVDRDHPWRSALAAVLDQPYDPIISAEVRGQANPLGALLRTWLEWRLGVPVSYHRSRGPAITDVIPRRPPATSPSADPTVTSQRWNGPGRP